MTQTEAETYFEKLTAKQALRFNLLVKTALTLGKPIEGAYEYAKTMMEIQEDLDNEEIDLGESERALIQLDEKYAKRLAEQ